MKDPYKIVKCPLATEKGIRLMERENKLMFIVEKKANKASIKNAIESLFKVKIIKVNTLLTPAGKKKAYVTLSPETPAIDIATQLGLI